MARLTANNGFESGRDHHQLRNEGADVRSGRLAKTLRPTACVLSREARRRVPVTVLRNVSASRIAFHGLGLATAYQFTIDGIEGITKADRALIATFVQIGLSAGSGTLGREDPLRENDGEQENEFHATTSERTVYIPRTFEGLTPKKQKGHSFE